MQAREPSLEFRSWGGGDQLEKAGVPVRKHYRELAFMGFVEVVKNLRTILRNFDQCKADILDFQPDVILLVDYPGFNLRMAKWAKAQGFKVIYYIAPQLWAWKKGRIKTFKSSVDHLLVILPFEETFFKKEGYQQVTYVGHPLLDHILSFKKDLNFRQSYPNPELPLIALLPGSRKQEIRTMLPIFLTISKSFPDHQFVIAGAPGQSLDFYQDIMTKTGIHLPVLFEQTYQLLAHSRAAVVTSGTATLETALFNVPQVVCYKGNAISFQIAKRIVQVDYISLVNLIAQKEVVTELIQEHFNLKRVKQALEELLIDSRRTQITNDYQLIREKLGDGGASDRAARLILDQ